MYEDKEIYINKLNYNKKTIELIEYTTSFPETPVWDEPKTIL